MIRRGLTLIAGSRFNQRRESMPGMQRVERPAADEVPHAAMNASSTTMTSHDTRPPHNAMDLEEHERRRRRRSVNLMTIVAGVVAFNTVASVVAGGPSWWTRAWAVALVVALLPMLVKMVRMVRAQRGGTLAVTAYFLAD
jgi:hypothetical protein